MIKIDKNITIKFAVAIKVEFATDMDLCLDCRKKIRIWDEGACSHELS